MLSWRNGYSCYLPYSDPVWSIYLINDSLRLLSAPYIKAHLTSSLLAGWNIAIHDSHSIIPYLRYHGCPRLPHQLLPPHPHTQYELTAALHRALSTRSGFTQNNARDSHRLRGFAVLVWGYRGNGCAECGLLPIEAVLFHPRYYPVLSVPIGSLDEDDCVSTCPQLAGRRYFVSLRSFSGLKSEHIEYSSIPWFTHVMDSRYQGTSRLQLPQLGIRI